MGAMPETTRAARAPTGTAGQKRAMREAARRRQAMTILRVTEALLGESAAQLGNGLGPEQARMAVVEVAGELAAVAESLRRLARLPPAERGALAVQLAKRGYGTQDIATRLGVSVTTAWNYKNGRRGDGRPWAG
jgi:hypothetical protein